MRIQSQLFPWFTYFDFVSTYQIFTWVSVRLRLRARFKRSQTDKYRVVLNLFSKDTNCSYVKAVRALLVWQKKNISQKLFEAWMLKIYLLGFELLPCDFPSPFLFESLIFESVSLPSISLPSASSHKSSGSISFRSFTEIKKLFSLYKLTWIDVKKATKQVCQQKRWISSNYVVMIAQLLDGINKQQLTMMMEINYKIVKQLSSLRNFSFLL